MTWSTDSSSAMLDRAKTGGFQQQQVGFCLTSQLGLTQTKVTVGVNQLHKQASETTALKAVRAVRKAHLLQVDLKQVINGFYMSICSFS